jgi:hypothetical protein
MRPIISSPGSTIGDGFAVALHFGSYKFCRVHQTLRVTAAMEAGIADHVWSVDEIVAFETP